MNHPSFNSLITLALLSSMLFIQGPAWAWGTQCHQVIAGLTSEQLTAKARQQVDRLLALEPGATLVSVSTWADI
jgi:hypothetical protein